LSLFLGLSDSILVEFAPSLSIGFDVQVSFG
jgi:hypothetical protein